MSEARESGMSKIRKFLGRYRPPIEIHIHVEVDFNDNGNIVYLTSPSSLVDWEDECLQTLQGTFSDQYSNPDNPLPYIRRENGKYVLISGVRDVIPAYPLVSLTLLDHYGLVLEEFESTDGGKTITVDEYYLQNHENLIEEIELVMTDVVENERDDRDEMTQ